MKHKNTLKLFASALALIGAGTIFFSGAIEAVMAAEIRNVQVVPTSYQIPASSAPDVSKDSKKTNCHISMDELNADTPTAADLSMEKAAETGIKYLEKIYEQDFENAYVFMSYTSGTQTFPRAFWSGDVLFSNVRTPDSTRWTFMIDSVTGELFNICHSENLSVSVPLSADAALAKDFSAYAALAKTHAKRCELLSGEISQITYNGQGYSGNDPTITLDVMSEKGEIISMDFSRYDQSLLGIITDSSRKITESVWNDAVGETKVLDAQ